MRQLVGFGDRSTGRGTFEANLLRAILTSGDFTAYVYDNAATRPFSQITLGKLVVELLLNYYFYCPRAIIMKHIIIFMCSW